MNKYFFTICFLLSSAATFAQNPKEMVITVEYKNDAGEVQTLDVSSVGKNSFTFVGGKGVVKHYVYGAAYNEETSQEDNQNVYAFHLDVLPSRARVVVNTTAAFSGTGIILSKESTADVASEMDALVAMNKNSNRGAISASVLYDNKVVAYMVNDEVRKGQVNIASLDVTDLEYMTTYYYRPFVVLEKGKYMLGSEKSFTTIRTIEAALVNEPQLAGMNHFDAASGLCLNANALKQIMQSWSYSNEEVNAYQLDNIGKLFMSQIDETNIDELKSQSTEKIVCTDGTICIVDKVSANALAKAVANLEAPFTFDPSTAVNWGMDSKGAYLFTKYCSVDTIQNITDPNYVYGSYISASPSSSTSNPFLGINIPDGLLPGDYTITVTFAPNTIDMDNSLPNRMYIDIYEAIVEQDAKQGTYPTTGTHIPNPDGSGNYFLPNNGKNIDKVSFDVTIGDSFASPVLQFKSQVTSKLASTYDRTLRIAQIEVKPKK